MKMKTIGIKIINDKETKPNNETLINAVSTPLNLQIEEILKINDFQLRININSDLTKIIEKIESGSKKLSELSSYTLGMQVYHNSIHKKIDIDNRIYHSKIKINETFYPESGGSNIKRYSFLSNFKEFVSYGEWCYNKPDWKFCSEERILIREIPDKNGLNCCLTDTGHIPNKAVIIVKGKNIDNRFLLGLLNSRLIGFYIFNSTEKGIQRLFPRVSLTSVRNLPIRISEKQNVNNLIIDNVKLIMGLYNSINNERLQEKIDQIKSKIDYCENRINEIVYQLYGLTEEEIRIVEKNI